MFSLSKPTIYSGKIIEIKLYIVVGDNMNNLYQVPDFRNIVKAQISANQAFSSASLFSKNFSNYSTKGIQDALNSIRGFQYSNRYNKALKEAVFSTSSLRIPINSISPISKQFKVSTDIAKQLNINNIFSKQKQTIAFNSAASINSEIRKSLQPLLSSGNLKLMSTVNDVANRISANPTVAYNSFQKALSQQKEPLFKEIDKKVRDQIKYIEKEQNKSQNISDSDRRVMNTEEAIKELQNPSKIDKARDQHFKLSAEYFIFAFQIITFLLFIPCHVINNDTFDALIYLFELIDKAIMLYSPK